MDVIHLLPDDVANQIAAGEVVQRPASVIKELVENSIDAGATDIKIILKEAGRTLIQVIDNGKGMSSTDARMAFERHATSKITKANDLFGLRTMGFRGEALASIAAVAQVELQTRQEGEEIGTKIVINGGKTETQEPVTCAKGSNFAVKNLFFNIPARRKFLKQNSTEYLHIERTFFCIALVYPNVSFELIHNDQCTRRLPASGTKERICNIFGKSLDKQLLSMEGAESNFANIKGFVGKPETSAKRNDKQYFFVNGRYMKHPSFHKAVMQAYDRLVQPGTNPTYFIYLDVDPSTIDVNIHPTKTEIKFENDQEIWSIMQSAVREVLGKFNVTNSIDFDQTDLEMPSYLNLDKSRMEEPKISVDPTYNPFNTQSTTKSTMADSFANRSMGGSYSPHAESNKRDWSALFSDFESQRKTPTMPDEPNTEPTFIYTDDTDKQLTLGLEQEDNEKKTDFLQYQNKYIITTAKSGVMYIDQHRAHIRILYDKYKNGLAKQKTASQRLLYPEQMELSAAESMMLRDIKDDLAKFGYDISDFGENTFVVNAVPADNPDQNPTVFIHNMIDSMRMEEYDTKEKIMEQIAMTLARTSAIQPGQKLHPTEMANLVNNLFACPEHSMTPDNKPIIAIIGDEDLRKRFK